MGKGVEAEPGPEVLGDTPAIDDFSDAASSSSGGFFLLDIMSDVATSSGMPFQYMTATFAIVITLVFMVVGLRIFGSALPGAFVAVVALVVFWQMGAIPGWMPWVFGIAPVPFFLIWKRASA